MKPSLGRVVKWVVGVGILVAGIIVLWRFPWEETRTVILRTDLFFLLLALITSLLSLAAKGWAWEWLVKPIRNVTWLAVQEANLIGAAVTNISVSMVGEAARVHALMRRSEITWKLGLASVIYLRFLEGVGLGILIAIVPFVTPLPRPFRIVQLVAFISFAVIIGLTRLHAWDRLFRWLPKSLRSGAQLMAEMASTRHLPRPGLLVMLNLASQWLMFHLVFLATYISSSFAVSFTAMFLTNAGGLVRLTPGNVGVFQALVALGVLPFGVSPGSAVAAGIVVQAIQIVPTVALGSGIAGLKELREIHRRGKEKPPPDEVD